MKFILTLLLMLVLSISSHAVADPGPGEPVRLLCDTLLDVMKQGNALGFSGRENKLRPVIAATYDMTAVSKTILGLSAAKVPPDQIDRLADAYSRFSVATYATLFKTWSGERFDVEDPLALPNGTTMVPSWIVGGDGKRTSINYVVREDNGVWRIVDVLFAGAVSQVAVRRSEFMPIFRENGLPALIAMIDDKSRIMEK